MPCRNNQFKIVVWLVAIIVIVSPFFLTVQVADGASSDHNQALLARLVREPRVRVESVVVAAGNYITGYFDHVTGSTDIATYAVTEVLNGQLSAEVDVMFDGGTAPRELPKAAILLLIPAIGDDSLAAPLGGAVWRGILPYSPEKWEEMKKTDFEKLAKNKPELQIPLSEAIRMVEQDWLKKGVGSEVVQFGRYDAMRTGFSWIIRTLKPTDEPNVYMPAGMHEVTDDLLIRMHPQDDYGPIKYFFPGSSPETLDAQVVLKPETLNITPGVLTAHIMLPAGYPVSGISSATCDGARFEQMMLNENASEMIIKFRRQDIETALAQSGENLDTHFVVRGVWQGDGGSRPFEGSASIVKIIDE